MLKKKASQWTETHSRVMTEMDLDAEGAQGIGLFIQERASVNSKMARWGRTLAAGAFGLWNAENQCLQVVFLSSDFHNYSTRHMCTCVQTHTQRKFLRKKEKLKTSSHKILKRIEQVLSQT